ncbi:universal stress protein [Micromonospora sp. NPDC047548]|uniref:universal stress protein n=1 Tax=Micromonospora sp. NPDC047548 TaxID=3155624 RepID=UPI0033C04EC8
MTDEYAALAAGPVVLGWDSSAGAGAAQTTARQLFPTRDLLLGSVGGDATEETTAVATTGDQSVTAVEVHSGLGAPGRAVAEALTAFARDRGAALLMVGSRGRSAVRKILLGRVAIAAVHRAHRPVMVVPRNPTDRGD